MGTIVYLEDLKRQLGALARILALCRSWASKPRRQSARTNDPAVVLFTSGSEGTPRGVVVLSHHNLLANRHQLEVVVDVSPKDVVLKTLDAVPLLGTGKVDYVNVGHLVSKLAKAS